MAHPLPKRYYPVYLNLDGKSVLLVGGGAVALQKIPALLESGARVTLVSPEISPEIEAYVRTGRVGFQKRGYQADDLNGAVLVIAATDDPLLQKQIYQEAQERSIWANIVDVPPLCDFIAPAIVNRGDLQIAISTGGASPALAKYLRKKLESWVGQEYADFVALAQQHRPAIMQLPKDQRLALWECLASDSFLDELKTAGKEQADRRIRGCIRARAGETSPSGESLPACHCLTSQGA